MNEYPYSCLQLKDKSYLICGTQKDQKDNSSYSWVVKLDSRGILVWDKTYKGGDDDGFYSICNAPNNGFVVAGKKNKNNSQKDDAWVVQCNSDGELIWETTYGGIHNDAVNSIVKPANGYTLCGTRTVDVTRNSDFWILKLGEKGEFEWDRSFGGTSDDIIVELFQTEDGGYTFWGDMIDVETKKVDTWIVKLSNEGYIEWERTIGGFGAETATSVIRTMDDGFMICGESVFSSDFNSNFWILKLDSQGDIEFDNEFIGPGKKLLAKIVQVKDGSYVLSGITDQNVSFQKDLFLLKFRRMINPEDTLYAKISEYVTSDYVGGMFLPIQRKRLKHFEPLIYLTDKNKITAKKVKMTPTTFIYENKYFQQEYQYQVQTETKTLGEFNRAGVHREVPVIRYYGRYGALFPRMSTRYIDKYQRRYSSVLRPRWQPRFEERYTPYKEVYEVDPKENALNPTHMPGRFAWKTQNLFTKDAFHQLGTFFKFESSKKSQKQQVRLTGYKVETPILVPMIFLWLVILAAVVIKILFSMRK
ncbi:MAG: hypothetical protein JW794_07730 [Candidatus Cloacimonetes bacterium]|nr:hypothetical protein [Candidatus Cloacimonadota bacterium]